jgi:FG-GAP repeat
VRSEVAVQGVLTARRGAARRSGRLRFGVVVLLVGVAAALGCVARLVMLPGGAARSATTARDGLTSLPLAAQSPVSAALGHDQPAYRVTALKALNPAQHLRAGFSRGGVTVASGKARLGIALSAYGYANALHPGGFAAPRADANRVTYTYSGLTVWYANGPLGLEQGFTVTHAPTSGAGGPLAVVFAISGNVRPKLTEGGRGLTFARAGRTVLRYAALQASDARGRVLRSWLALEKGRILLRVDTAGAHYPLRIDPLIQQGEKLTGAGEIASGRFGYSVALSADGDTALIGARYAIRNNNEAGGAWVFTRSGSTWTQQGGKLNGTGHAGETLFDHIGEGAFGYSVALSANGNTALIGAPDDNGGATNEGGVGAVWVFTRSGSAWAQQGEKLTGTGETGKGEFGKSVVLSADGNTALIGGSADNGEAGAAWVFTRSGSAWAQQGEKLVGDCTASCTNEGTGETGEGMFGTSVALSEDGETAVVSGPADSSGVGAAWVFTRSGSTWTQQGEKLIGDCTASCANEGTGETGKGEFGKSVVLSANGDTTLIGAPADSGGVGAAWVFTRSGSTWTQQGEKLVGDCTASCANEGTGEAGAGKFGTSVALAEDGDTAMIGGPADSGGVGAAWVFTRSGSTWSEQGEKLTGTGETGEGEFGYSVALSEDGNTVLIGGPEDDTATGAVWAFTRSGGVWSQQGVKLSGGEEGNSQFGVYVALSADGNTALIGGPGDNYDAGAAWVFTRSGGVWSQQGAKLTGRGETKETGFGVSVALSADGNTALIGAPGDDGGLFGKGAAWVFTRSDGVWTQQGEKFVGDCTGSCANEGTGETGEGRFGVTVALSADGNTALIGGLDDNSTRGAVWLFTRSGSTWTQQGEKLTGGGEAGEGEFGTNVALSADGGTAMAGAWRDNGGRGAAWVFVIPPAAATGAATGVGETGATLNGTLGAGDSSTAYFQYGTTAAYGSSTATQSVGASSSPRTLAAAIGGLAPGTTYHFRLVAENSGGVAYGGDQTFTTEARGATSTTEGTTSPTQPTATSPSIPSQTLPPPAVAHARQSAARWRESNQLARISRAKTPTGTTFSFSLNEQAAVTFSFTQILASHRRVKSGTLSFTGHSATNTVAFAGRISRADKLKPGRYELVITATNSAGQRSQSVSLSFTIVK